MSASNVKVDARGISCPEPVIMTIRALKENPEKLEVLVDNATAKGNIERFAKISGYRVVTQEIGNEFIITIRKAY